ncbi:type II CAAX endopeptidase family protein [soil metagenome]
MRIWLQRYRVPVFLALTFGWTWGVIVPMAFAAHGLGHARRSNGAMTLAAFSPTVVAFGVVAAAYGRRSVAELWQRVWQAQWRQWWRWYLGVALVPIVLLGCSLLVLPLLGQSLPSLGPWYTPLLGTLMLIPLTGFMEEVGWRGFLQDAFERRHSPLVSALLVSAAWGPWHIPSYLRLESEGAATPLLIVLFLAGVVPLSVLLAWVYHRTDRRILPVIIAHAAIDASAGYFLGPVRTGELRPFTAWVVVLYASAALVLWRDRSHLRGAAVEITSPFSSSSARTARSLSSCNRALRSVRHSRAHGTPCSPCSREFPLSRE